MSAVYLHVALPTPLRCLFDYLPPEVFDLKELIPGIRVKVPFQSKEMTGVLVSYSNQSNVPCQKLRRAKSILDQAPVISDDIFKLCQFAADYYHNPLGEMIFAALPTLLRKGKNFLKNPKPFISKESIGKKLPLNIEQESAVADIVAAHNHFQVFLLEGVTGSGKTEVYLQAIENFLKRNQQILVLVPEISLTPQTLARFRARFSVNVVMLHSDLSDKERLSVFMAAKEGGVQIVIGTRLALFTPFQTLGLIIVDEEHDLSFKQQDRLRYHARDLAIMRANLNHIPIVLGSATPSLESLLNVYRKRYRHLKLPNRAGLAKLPQYHLIDLRQYPAKEGLSSPLLEAMEQQLKLDRQVMLFLNRRGFAPVLFCTHCQFIPTCRRCEKKLVYHTRPERLRCHYCDIVSLAFHSCVKCQHASLIPLGLGTQRIENILQQYFPTIPIIRFDRDNTQKKGSLENLLEQIRQENPSILLGTQMLAKGHHFPNVTLVGIIDADSGFYSADFRANLQVGQLLTQVSGRAGRGQMQGNVLIQTYNPQHSLLQLLIKDGYPKFAQVLLKERQVAELPPYGFMALIRADSYQQEKGNQFLKSIKEKVPTQSVEILGPIPAMLPKRKGLYSQQLLIKTKERKILQDFLKKLQLQIATFPQANTIKWFIDVDPVDL